MKLFTLKQTQSQVYLDILAVIYLLSRHRLEFQREVVTHIELTAPEVNVIEEEISLNGTDMNTAHWPEYFCGLFVSKEKEIK